MTTIAATRYDRHKAKMAERVRTDSSAAREISGLMPSIANPSRRRAASACFRTFCETYFPSVFFNPWSPDHLVVIAALERAVTVGTQQAIAMPRGTGKTTLTKLAALWAVLTGRRRFVMCIGSSKDKADAMAESIATFLLFKTLRDDFPETCYPIYHVRAAKQSRPLFLGEPINFTNKNGLIVFPLIPGSAAAGARIQCAGIEGSIRGISATDITREDEFRPDLVLIDDFQTDQSARSETQCETRLKIIRNSIQGLNAAGRSLGVIAAITVIRSGDAADRLLDRKANPSWRGLRFGFINQIPTELPNEPTAADRRRVELWQAYLDLRTDHPKGSDTAHLPTEFYAAHRAEMDHGLTVRWEHRFESDNHEISAIQHAVNTIQDRGLDTLHAEYNNQPMEASGADVRLDAPSLMSRLNRLPRGVAPHSATRVTAAVDIHGDVLYWLALATDDEFRGDVIDYGTYPDQPRRVFQKHECHRTYPKLHSDQGTIEAQLTAAIHATLNGLIGRTYRREDGVELSISKCLVDAKWGDQIGTVYAAIRTSGHAQIVMPSEGEGLKHNKSAMSSWKPKKGEQNHKKEWIIAQQRGQLRVRIDTDFWKTFAANRLTVAVGAPGSLNLYGSDPEQHRNIVSHFVAEHAFRREGLRTVHEWEKKKPERDNHWWDCLIYSLVAASILGATIKTTSQPGASTGTKRWNRANIPCARR